MTRKQLEDAAKCEEKGMFECQRCSLFGAGVICAEAAAQTALALADMLKRLEWEPLSKFCPICNGIRDIGHNDNCELAAMLKESEGSE